MPASEYGSYYWCVILSAKDGTADNKLGESIHLHADSVSINDAGTLTFVSAGRRPTGVEPSQHAPNGDQNPPAPNNQGQQAEKPKEMIYMAFAPGTWKIMYAAKLRDGSPALVEHWTSADGAPAEIPVPPKAGAAGFTD